MVTHVKLVMTNLTTLKSKTLSYLSICNNILIMKKYFEQLPNGACISVTITTEWHKDSLSKDSEKSWDWKEPLGCPVPCKTISEEKKAV